MVYQVAYVSSAAPTFSDAEITEILDISRRNNAAAGVTGMLLTHDGNFFQVLEGAQDAVAACYRRIASDPRHVNPIILMDKQVENRAFVQWSMGHAQPDQMSDEHRDIIVSLARLAHTLNTRNVSDTREISILAKNFIHSFRDFALA